MKFTDLVPWKTRAAARQSGDDSVTAFRREVNRLFDNFFTQPLRFSDDDGSFSPTVDISETDANIKVKAELPGMDEKNVELLLDENSLTIRGEKKDESERTEEGIQIKESSFGRFERIIPLPTEIESERVDAKFKRGVLTVTLPKTEKAKKARKKIPVSG